MSDWVYPPEWRFLKNGEIRVVPTPYEETLEKCLATYQRAGKGNYEPPKYGDRFIFHPYARTARK